MPTTTTVRAVGPPGGPCVRDRIAHVRTRSRGTFRVVVIALDEQLCFPLYATSRAFTRAYAEVLAPFGLTYVQYLALLVLWEEGEVGVGRVGERLELDSGTLTPLPRRLQRDGWVTRTRDPEDERRVLVALTDEGAALEARVQDVPGRIRAASGLDDGEVDELKALLEQTLAALRDRTEEG